VPHNHEWQSRIKAVEREYLAMRQAADRFLEAASADPTILLENLRYREIVGASQHLEGTYVVHVRNYRNSLVHEREEKTDPVPMVTARGYLCRFFSFLRPEW
jgi:hypothetical protein